MSLLLSHIISTGEDMHSARQTHPGLPLPLGVHWDGHGVNVAVYSRDATAVWFCLFDEHDGETERIPLTEWNVHAWHCYAPGIQPGQRYGYRVNGPYAPDLGLRFNPAKLLLDPYAREIHGAFDWDGPIYAYPRTEHPTDLVIDHEDSASSVPKSVVIDPAFDWGDDRLPRTPWAKTVIYEAHVKGFTKQHPGIPEHLRGTYAGLAHPASIDHLRTLGITAVEILPIHAILDEEFLAHRGLTNYWGYSSIGFFAPDQRYAADRTPGGITREFKGMVKLLHQAGIEVLLDVVYNHTGEGHHLGPTVAFRGLDNTTYYRLLPGEPRYYSDVTGTGNTINAPHPQSLKLIMDSLRYWVEEMHVDGFRFDLAPALAREAFDVDPMSAFFDIIHQDPVLSRTKLIAEPWDIGEGGYQIGNFPVLWSEWNGKFRDGVRAFWLGKPNHIAEIGYRVSGSSDLYGGDGRKTWASVNFLTAHDGFTLHDLVSYERKHNEANGEDNRDGTDANFSTNFGVEGETGDPEVRMLRERRQRTLLATLILSQGVPMICGGDELGRTQLGNNNAYCLDNEISWLDWTPTLESEHLFKFTKELLALRRSQPTLCRTLHVTGRPGKSGMPDLTWFRPDGPEMTSSDWADASRRSVAFRLAGDALAERAENGQPLVGDTLLVILNADAESVIFTLPPAAREPDAAWEVLVNTERWDVMDGTLLPRMGQVKVRAGTVVCCRSIRTRRDRH